MPARRRQAKDGNATVLTGSYRAHDPRDVAHLDENLHRAMRLHRPAGRERLPVGRGGGGAEPVCRTPMRFG